MAFFDHFHVVQPQKKGLNVLNSPKVEVDRNNTFLSVSVPQAREFSHREIFNKREKKRKSVSQHIEAGEYDIFKMDSIIRGKLMGADGHREDLYSQLKNLKWIIKNSDDPVDVLQSKNKIGALREKIKDIENSFSLALYSYQTCNILVEYKNILEETSGQSFFGAKRKCPKKEIRKDQLVSDFLRIAQFYIKIENFRKQTALYCGECFSTEFECLPGSGEKICKNCAVGRGVLDDSPCYKDSDRVNMSTRYKYVCKSHFIAAMDQFEGKQNSNIKAVKKILEKEMEDHSLTKTTLTKRHIYMFLSDKKLSDHYKDINLIFFCLTGKKPPNIAEIRDELLLMYSKFMEVYEEVKDPSRQNSLNVGFMFRNFLFLLDFECDDDNFFFLKTPNKAKEHHEKWREVIDELRKRYPGARTSKGKEMWRHLNGTIH